MALPDLSFFFYWVTNDIWYQKDITYTFWSYIANVDFCELQGKNLLDPVGTEDYCSKNIFVPFFESAKKTIGVFTEKNETQSHTIGLITRFHIETCLVQ